MRILVRVVLWPVRMALMLLEWMILFVTHFVGIGCYLLSAGCVVIAVAGWLMGLASVEDTLRTLGIGFAFFVIPLVGEWMICAIKKIGYLTNYF